MEVAGTVQIQIGGNIAPFEQALAKAQQLAVTFDAQVSQKLSGAGVSEGLARIAAGVEQTNTLLLKMAGSGTQAGAAMTKITGEAKNATGAVAQLGSTAASTSTQVNQIGAGAAAGLTAATVSAKEFALALEAAGGDLTKINVQVDEQASEVKAVTDALRGYSRAQIDAFRSQQEGAEFNRMLNERVGIFDQASKSARDSAAAFQEFGLTETEVAVNAREAAQGIGATANAAKLGSAQMMALTHSGRSAIESLALGAPVTQVLTQQLNHLSFAMSGPQGLIAASAGVREAFGTWLATIPGMVSTAGIAAVAAVTAYVLATREKIASVSELLESHKTLLDEIANTYPHMTQELQKYAAEAQKLPHSVLAADTNTQIDKDRAALSASLDHLKVDLLDLARAQDVVGSAGAEAFQKLADTIDAGNVDTQALVKAVGDIRLDQSLTPDARKFAENIQAGALEADKLQQILNKDMGLKNVGIDGGKATKTLAEMAAGATDLSSKAGSATASMATLFGTIANGSEQRFGVSRSLGLDGIINQTQQAGAAIQQMRREQVQGLLDLDQQFRDTTKNVEELKEAIATGAGKENVEKYFGDVSNITNANAEIQNAITTVNKLFNALNSGGATANTVAAGIEMIREQLIKDGFGTQQVEKFIADLVAMRSQMDAGINKAAQLNTAIQAIRNRVVTVTVQTRQVGTGTMSTYDLAGGGSVNVTRYGAPAGSTSGPTTQSYSVPTESGYGSQGGTGSGSTNVNVTRFATGGMIHPGDTQSVSFFKSPDETVGIFTPGQMQALADPQSGFTGAQPTANDNRMWTVQMNIEANTQKTAQLLDDIKTSSASAFSGSSYSGSSSGADMSQQDQLSAQYMNVLKQIQSNFKAAGIVGRGIIGYGLDGLAATPQEIARNIVYGGAKPTIGFDTGGQIAPGDTQHVEFFKNPNERVIIARPDQFNDVRSQATTGDSKTSNDNRPITFNMPITVNGSGQVSNDSIAEMKRQFALALREGLRSINGR